MKKKIIWIRYLIIGVLSVFVNCTNTIDYVVKADFIYTNNTNHIIELSSTKTIKPNETIKIAIQGDGDKYITETSYVPPYPFESGAIIKYGNIKCDFLEPGIKVGQGEGPAGIQNYEWKKISERYYEFTYHFTEKEFNQAENCN